MTREECLNTVNDICKDVFEDESIVINDSTTANDIEEWDSLTHLQLISEIETEYNIKFKMGEIQGFSNIGELLDTIMGRVNS